jgi:hypothetical protein
MLNNTLIINKNKKEITEVNTLSRLYTCVIMDTLIKYRI